jgi:hypothetical protein
MENSFDPILTLLAACGLSLSAGVRAYLPLVAIGIASDVGPIDAGPIHYHLVLRNGFEWLGNPVVIGLFVLLAIYEFSADKIPVIDHLNDVVHTVIRPLSGALIFTATGNSLSDVSTFGPILAAIAGAGLAGTTHAAKAAVVRPASTVTTAGMANPLVSLVEDVLTFLLVLVSIILPILAGAIVVVTLVLAIIGISALLRRRRAKRAAQAVATGGART